MIKSPDEMTDVEIIEEALHILKCCCSDRFVERFEKALKKETK